MDLRRLHHASDKERVAARVAEYQDFFAANGGGVEERKRDYKKFIVDYYDLVAGLYEYGWGRSFHFAPRYVGESFAASLALQDGPSIPWYEPLAGSGLSLASFRSSSVGRMLVHRLLQAMELFRVVPRGTVHVNRLLNLAARGMIDSGRLGIFTPMYFMHARRPS